MECCESSNHNLIGKWASTVALDTFTQSEALSFVRRVTHHDARLDQAFGKYMLKINTLVDHCLCTAIIDYCLSFAVRNPNVLDATVNFFTKRAAANRIPIDSLSTFVLPLGLLQHCPAKESTFWKVLDMTLELNFFKMRPSDVLDVLLSCIYLGKFPFKFVNKLVDPTFLRLFNDDNDDDVDNCCLRDKLRLLDVAMTVECEDYKGPMFVLSSSAIGRDLPLPDVRKSRAVKLVLDSLGSLTADNNRFSVNVALQCFARLDFYKIDILIHDDDDNNNATTAAVLIHPRQHYCVNSRQLLGPQVMKSRQLRKMGFRLISLNLESIEKSSAAGKLTNYLQLSWRNAELPLNRY